MCFHRENCSSATCLLILASSAIAHRERRKKKTVGGFRDTALRYSGQLLTCYVYHRPYRRFKRIVSSVRGGAGGYELGGTRERNALRIKRLRVDASREVVEPCHVSYLKIFVKFLPVKSIKKLIIFLLSRMEFCNINL